MSIYLDNNATTRLDPRVLEAMLPLLSEHWGNPGSGHSLARPVAQAVNAARRDLAERFGLEPTEIIFTGSATEADNLAIRGVMMAASEPRHLIVTAVEHPAVLETAEALQNEGVCSVSILGVDAEGQLDLDELEQALRPGETRLVSVMGANNETGVRFPIPEIADLVHAAGALLHVDAVQVVGKIEDDWTRWPADLIALAAHKFHGPKGSGMLTVPKRVKVQPQILGGGQERGLRSGTANPPAIVGLATALALALDTAAECVPRMRALRDRMEAELSKAIDGLAITAQSAVRNGNTSHLSFENLEAEPILLHLDREGIACSAGSACSTGALVPSHVLTAMAMPAERVHGALRFSLSRETTAEEIDRVVEILPPIVDRLQKLR